MPRSTPRHRSRVALTVAGVYVLAMVYYRFRPPPPGVNGQRRSYRVPAEDLSFYIDAAWYEDGERRCLRQITDELLDTIRRAARFVLLDVFLFNLHHLEDGSYVPTTRQIADALRQKQLPAYFITDPLNTSYRTAYSEPLAWLRESGATVCLTDIDRLRDNNLLYAPIWRLLLQWFGTQGPLRIRNPLRNDRTTTLRAVLRGLNARGNHRKVIVADEGDSYATIVTSSNFEDASSYFTNVAVKVRSQAVAHHFLEAEKAVARMSGYEIPAEIPPAPGAGDAAVTPLMGAEIRRSLLNDLRTAGAGDELFVFVLFLSDRGVIDALVEASWRGARVTVVLDQNKISFGQPKSGLPNQIVAAELMRRCSIDVRGANTRREEFHPKLVLLQKGPRCIVHAGSANFTRRSLSNTNLEANVRVEAAADAPFCRDALHFGRWYGAAPRSLPFPDPERSRLRYVWYRVLEALGIGTW